ncbi:hypothetical protein HZP35_17580 [Elizabethkingia anophelis]|nr:hypothetical protein [Elizabethkingia anophelis]MCT4156750.1 hypothetical protein [Elizabethkingia anophelis]MCT4171071.1 hypothetical protein [Elizabethkingia anophelis]MCT4245486.1 hypothetical protein [Elizabethkingia anophelis]MCT4249219.1 hypothetical protein [Elizabethkingia anophelis]
MSSENNLLPFVKPIPVDKIPINNNPSAASTLLFADEQLNPRRVSIQYFNEKIASGVTGTIKTQQTLPELNALPDGIYRASTFGNYANGFTVERGVLTLFKKVGTVWTVDTEILMPNSTTPTWEPKSYDIGSQVIFNGILYEANTNTIETDIPGVEIPNTPSKWDIKLIGFNISESNDLLQFTAKNGADLFHIDKDGYFWALYYPNSIPVESVAGLDDHLKVILKGIFYETISDKIMNVVSPDNKIALQELPDGSIYIPNLIVDDLTYNAGKPVVSDNITGETYFTLPDPGLLKLDFSVTFPTEVGIKNRGTVRFIIGGVVMLTANCEVSVQGSGSVVFPKKGYTIDLFNVNWKKLQVKIGKYPALDSYHMKAYWTDATKCKDVFCGLIWQQMRQARPYPENLNRSLNNALLTNYDPTRFSADAQFALVGFPTDVYQNGSFRGQYVLRLKKDRLNYAMSSTNQNHLLIDSQTIDAALGRKAYADFNAVAVDYENRNPKTPNATAKANIFRLFQYMRDIYTGAKTFTDTHQDYLRLYSWIDFLIWGEAICHWDSVNNNAMYSSYNATHWGPDLIDTDFVLGTNQGGDLVQPSEGWYIGNKDIWPKFRAQMLPQIKARYTVLRGSVLKMENLTKTFLDLSANWSPNSYQFEFNKWGTITMTRESKYLESIDNVFNTLDFRLKYLDKQFL